MLYQIMLNQKPLLPMMNSLSQQFQLQQQSQIQPQLQHQQPPNLSQVITTTPLVPTSCAAPGSRNNSQNRGLTHPNGDLKKLWQLQFQSRWIGKAWHIQTIRALGDWTFHLRTWNVLQDMNKTPLLACLQHDNLQEFQQLIASGRYSMYDRDKYKTLFEVRVAWFLTEASTNCHFTRKLFNWEA